MIVKFLHGNDSRIVMSLVCLFSISATNVAELPVQVVNQRGMPVRDAVVEIVRAGGTGAAPSFPWRYAVGQRNLAFTPSTLIVPKGASVAFPNLDNVRHSVYSFSKAGPFRIDLYGRDQTRSQRFEVAGTIALGCNIHDQMRGYIRVTNTPFAAATQANGQARISGVGPGTYTVTVWHPQLRGPDGEQRQTVTIAPGQTLRLAISTR